MKKIVMMSLVASSMLMASGYKIPEASTNAVALSAANIAHTSDNADAAYYNPANMVFMSDTNNVEADLMYLGIDATKYNGTATIPGATQTQSESESFIVPSLHYVSGKLGESNARVGVSIVSPGGLSKRWTTYPGIASAEEFTLQLIEINPTAAFEVTNDLAIAVGFRILHSSGVVKINNKYGPATQNMTGDSIDFGYNLALAYHPIDNLEVALTYRSQIDLTVKGSADLTYKTLLNGNYDVSVKLPLPATFNAAIAYTLPTKTTVEFVYEKAYWSAYQTLNFEYQNATAEAVFGKQKAKNWKDTEAYRLGITQELDNLTLMAGGVIDHSPVPAKTLGFELPGSDSVSVSLGARYKINESVDIGLSGLYSMRDTRTISAADNNDNGIVGEFSGSNILIVSAGLGYKF